ncbi:MAG: bacteriocin family protein [Planctomycetes bacterium]|nr:bacteriocin family protein [Planctomycetota bacterium]
MNDLRRELAPITAEAWKEIEDEATRTLKSHLAARKLVDFVGPLGWEHSAVNLGRTKPLNDGLDKGIEFRRRVVQPIIELRSVFFLAREELDNVSRGAADPDLQPVIDAAKRLALAEDRIVFYGDGEAGDDGICPGSPHPPISHEAGRKSFPHMVAEAMETLREAGIAGPYALALDPQLYTELARTMTGAGYPVIRHVEKLLDGPIVWGPGLENGVVLSQRGGDFELVVGRDISIGYLDHDRSTVQLYLEESLAFRLLTPEAAVPLKSEKLMEA